MTKKELNEIINEIQKSKEKSLGLRKIDLL